MSKSNDLSDSDIDFSESYETKNQDVKTRKAEIEISTSSSGVTLNAVKQYNKRKRNKTRLDDLTKNRHNRDYRKRKDDKCPCCQPSSSSPEPYRKNLNKNKKKSSRNFCSCFEAGMKFILKNLSNSSAFPISYYPPFIKSNASTQQSSQCCYCPQSSNANAGQRDFSCVLKRDNGITNYEEPPVFMTLRSAVSKNF